MSFENREKLILGGAVTGSQANIDSFRLDPIGVLEQTHNNVCVAVRKDGCVGYFENDAMVPEGWKKTSPQDITDIMTSCHLNKQAALAMMNKHWQ